MEEVKEVNKEVKKLSYEELEQVAVQLSNEVNQLRSSFNVEMALRRLSYLFEVVKNREAFPTEFVNDCVSEIIENMTVPIQEKDN